MSRRLLLSLVFVLNLSGTAGYAAKPISSYYQGQRGGVRMDLVDELKADKPLAKRVLEECRKSAVSRERRSCVLYAYHIGDPGLASAVRPYLGDSDGKVRAEAAQALSSIAKSEALPWLTPLADDPDEYVRTSALVYMSRIDKGAIRELLRRKMKDESPLVALQSASLLASDGEEIDRNIALAHISSKPQTESRAIEIKSKALKLLGYAGNESDMAVFDEIAGHHSDYNKGDALIGKQQLKLKLSQSPAERAEILKDSFNNTVLQDWASNEAIRRYKKGDLGMADLLKIVAGDEKSSGRGYAQAALDYIKNNR